MGRLLALRQNTLLGHTLYLCLSQTAEEAMKLWFRKKKDLSLEKRVYRLIRRHGTLDFVQICILLDRGKDEGNGAIIRGLRELVAKTLIEPRLRPDQDENTKFFLVPWGLPISFRKKTKVARNKLAHRLLDVTRTTEIVREPPFLF